MIRNRKLRAPVVAGATISFVASLCGCSSPGESSAATGAAPVERAFTDVTGEAGLRQTHHKPALDPKLANIMPWMASVGAAAAAGDFDNDGWIDLYVTDSRRGLPNRLYRNNGDGSFSDVAEQAGVAWANDEGGVSMDCVWADFDNDGWIDLYVVRWGTDILYYNNGDGTLREVTRDLIRGPDGSSGTPWANGNGAVALDFDLDGRLDLYVANYFREVDLWNLESTRIMHDSFETARNAGRNFLYHQQPDGSFVDVAAQSGLDDTGWTLAVGSGDLNNDGWPDLYCANDFGQDKLFINRGQGVWSDLTASALGPDTRKGMNVDIGDFNNDGWLDIYVTNITTAEYLREGNMLWRNNGPGPDGEVTFMDISQESGTYNGGWGWGAKFLDYDNDGDQDLFTVNGFISGGEGNYWYDLASWTVEDTDPVDSRNWPTIGDRSFSGHERYRFWRNDGFESFSRIDGEVGLVSERDGRGIVAWDYDNDGDIDIFVANQGQEPHLFRNRAPADHHWLTVRLVADPTLGVNADAIGSRVSLVGDGGTQIRERDGGNGYAGQSDPRLHFGLGHERRVRLLEVRWPDGGLQYLEDVPGDRLVTIRQNPGEYVAAARTPARAPIPRKRPEVASTPELPAAELELLLSRTENELRADPTNHTAAHAYRRKCAEHGRHRRATDFFRELVEADPRDYRLRLELSVALIDEIPTCGGLAAIVCKGTLARKSLDQLDVVLAEQPELWLGHYSRGMNHLHWPRALRHSDDAVADFTRALEIQRAQRESTGRSEPYFERTYLLLGDSLAKNGSYERARSAWRDGLTEFPDSTELARRLAIEGDAALLAFVEERRSLEQPIDTNLAF